MSIVYYYLVCCVKLRQKIRTEFSAFETETLWFGSVSVEHGPYLPYLLFKIKDLFNLMKY